MKRLLAGFAAVVLIGAVAPQSAGAHAPDRVCGIEPGQGSFNYVEVWGTSCKTARKISRKAARKF
jgi:hypothetical protein